MKKILALALTLITLVMAFVIPTSAFDPSWYSLQEGATVTYNDPSTVATRLPSGSIVLYDLFHDDLTTNERNIVDKLVEIPNFGRVDARNSQPEQYDSVYTGTTETSPIDDYSTKWTTFNYEKTFKDDGGGRDYYLEPIQNYWYDKIYISISISKDGAVLPLSAVLPVTYTAITEGQYEKDYNGLLFALGGTYEVTIYVAFQDTGNNPKNANTWSRPYITSQTITFDSTYEIQQEYYNNGYANGYQSGYIEGQNSQHEWTVKAFIDAILNAPVTFIENALDFEVFGVNMASFVKVLFTVLVIAFVATVILKVVI